MDIRICLLLAAEAGLALVLLWRTGCAAETGARTVHCAAADSGVCAARCVPELRHGRLPEFSERVG